MVVEAGGLSGRLSAKYAGERQRVLPRFPTLGRRTRAVRA